MSEHSPELPDGALVVQTHGYTPRLWSGRSVVFFANLLSLFFDNEEGIAELEREISGADSYGGRLLPITGLLFSGGENVLVLEHAPNPALCSYFGQELGLSMPEVRVLPHEDYLRLGAESDLVEQLRDHPATWLDGYVTDRRLVGLAGALGKRPLCEPGASETGNNKRLFHETMEAAGHPVFETRYAENAGEVGACLAELAALGYRRAGVKSAIGASGIGLSICPTQGAEVEVPDYFFHDGPCMVQGWLETGARGVVRLASPSVQVFLDDDSVYLFDLTEQILSESSVHQGNESPPPYLDDHPGLAEELFRQAGDAGTWLHGVGYRGTASVDFLIAFDSDGGFTAYGCEINARVTGATYPSVLARHFLPRGGWLMRNLCMAAPVEGSEILSMLDAHGHLFRPGSTSGILPINFNLDADELVTKGQFLCLGSTPETCHQLLELADDDLPLRWEYARD